MTLNEYQEKAMTTCLPTCDNFSYMMLNLVGEVGELAGKVGKALRKETGAIVDYGEFYFYTHQRSGEPKSRELYNDLKSEAGDILWQLAGLCNTFGWTLEDVAQGNLDKLAARKAEGTIISHTDH
jgi:NTP pyrophosphatase (non-canonical NTP hydrolase)